ncbi:MAG: DUF1559 domain-containing protein [Phycisphaeraceae bacterium]|nr:MAG: DUF1559 domain-containing protein [Phycisphaeraceae bacterium]
MGSPRVHLDRVVGGTGGRRGFTLIDLLVSIAVIAVLIAIALPSLKLVHDTSRRVVCASNLRQVGLGIHMYATENNSELPYSSYTHGDWGTDPMVIRMVADVRGEYASWWDGLGVLYEQGYLSDGRIFYCPSHTGTHTFDTYADQFAGEQGEVLSNYGYRAQVLDDRGRPHDRLNQIVDSAALVSDGFREIADINHARGMNVLRAGMSVDWFADTTNWMLDTASQAGEGLDDPGWQERWRRLDHPTPTGGLFGGFFN